MDGTSAGRAGGRGERVAWDTRVSASGGGKRPSRHELQAKPRRSCGSGVRSTLHAGRPAEVGTRSHSSDQTGGLQQLSLAQAHA